MRKNSITSRALLGRTQRGSSTMRWQRKTKLSPHTTVPACTPHRALAHCLYIMDGGVPILMYHYVYSADNPPDVDGYDEPGSNYLLDEKLDARLAYLTENDFYFPSFQEVAAFIKGEHSLPEKSVVLTFDDAQKYFLNYGIPVLEKYQVPATSFVICDQKNAKKKIIDYASPYVSFQSHSYAMHHDTTDIGKGGVMYAMSKEEIVEDLQRSQELLGAGDAFAYPYGDVSDDGQAAVAEAGFACAFTTENKWAHVDDVTALPRVRISGEYVLEGFEWLVTEDQA